MCSHPRLEHASHASSAPSQRSCALVCHTLDPSMLHTHLGENRLSDCSHSLWRWGVIGSRSIVGRALTSRVRRSVSVKSFLTVHAYVTHCYGRHCRYDPDEVARAGDLLSSSPPCWRPQLVEARQTVDEFTVACEVALKLALEVRIQLCIAPRRGAQHCPIVGCQVGRSLAPPAIFGELDGFNLIWSVLRHFWFR